MAKLFGLIKSPMGLLWFDRILFGVGGLAHLLPALLAPVTGFLIFGISVQMVVGFLMVARVVDMFMK